MSARFCINCQKKLKPFKVKFCCKDCEKSYYDEVNAIRNNVKSLHRDMKTLHMLLLKTNQQAENLISNYIEIHTRMERAVRSYQQLIIATES